MLSKAVSITAEAGGRYRARCTNNPQQSAEYLYSVVSRPGLTTCRFISAEGYFGDPFDNELITSVLRCHRSRKA